MADSLPNAIRKLSRRTPKSSDDSGQLDIAQLVGHLLREGEPDIYRKVALAVDRAIMQAVLRHTKGNQVKASEMLGISRTTLRTKLRALGASIEKQLALNDRS
jgi:two-component system nitrogen regulation response regulator GlnG